MRNKLAWLVLSLSICLNAPSAFALEAGSVSSCQSLAPKSTGPGALMSLALQMRSAGTAVTGLIKTSAARLTTTASAVPIPGCRKLPRTGSASYYNVGRQTANGDRFNKNAMAAAHPNPAMLGKKIAIRDPKTGKTVKAVINDICPGCRTNGHMIDFTEGLFKQFAPTSQGVLRSFEIWVCS